MNYNYMTVEFRQVSLSAGKFVNKISLHQSTRSMEITKTGAPDKESGWEVEDENWPEKDFLLTVFHSQWAQGHPLQISSRTVPKILNSFDSEGWETFLVEGLISDGQKILLVLRKEIEMSKE